MLFSTYFPLKDLIRSQTATRHGIDNTPGPEVMANLVRLSQTLEFIEKELIRRYGPSARLSVSSGFRCPALNIKVGGESTSDHVFGRAADMSANVCTPLELAQLIAECVPNFERVIHEFGAWCHLSICNKVGVQDLKLLVTAVKVDDPKNPGKKKTEYLSGLLKVK